MRSPSNIWQRIYRLLLRLYPPRYRDRFGAEMVQLFSDLLVQERAQHGRFGEAVIALRTYLDLPRSALSVRRRWGRSARSQRPRKGDSMDSVAQDLRYALRNFRRSPGFTAVTVLTLALGIGANTAIFSVVNGVLFRPLPYENPEELVFVWNQMSARDGTRAPISGPDLTDFPEMTDQFTAFAGAWAIGTNLTGGDQPQQVTLSWVSPNFFSLFGVAPALGRWFVLEDKVDNDRTLIAQPGYTPLPGAVVLSHGLWQSSFGSDPDIIGRSIRANGQTLNVIGVAPVDFQLFLPVDASIPADADAWTLFPIDISQGDRGTSNLTVFARMESGVTVAQAQAEMDRVSQQLRETYPIHEQIGTQFEIAPMHAEVVNHVQPVLLTLFGAVGFVLLIACANVANLMLVRASARRREFAIRGAIGGGRWRIFRQMLTESLLLSLVGSAAGIWMATWGIDLLLTLRPENLPRVENVGIDSTVLAFTLGASILAAMLFGLAPAFQSTNTDVTEALNDRGSGSMSPRKNRLRTTLVVTEVALSLVLLIGAGLLLRSFASLSRVEPGFNPDHVLTTNISLPFFSYRDWDKRTAFFQQLTDRISNIPGVESVAGVTPLPLSGDARVGGFALEESQVDQWASNRADYRPVFPGYFATMETPLLSGRAFVEQDNRPGEPSVVVVDERFAARAWPGENPLGKRFLIQVPTPSQRSSQTAWTEVVGVVAHVRHSNLALDGPGTIYTPYHTSGWFEMSLVARTSVDPLTVASGVRQAVEALDAELPVYAVRTMNDYVSDAVAPNRFALVLIGVFAGVALVLASIGLYGVISYLVRQRTREIGIRMAFGAAGQNIVRLIVAQGMTMAIVGVGIGLAAAFVVTRVIDNLLFGVTATDPITFGGIAALLVAVSMLACYLPARRAMKVDPMVALRND